MVSFGCLSNAAGRFGQLAKSRVKATVSDEALCEVWMKNFAPYCAAYCTERFIYGILG